MGVRPSPRPCRTAGAKPRSTCSWATRTAGRTLIGWSPGRGGGWRGDEAAPRREGARQPQSPPRARRSRADQTELASNEKYASPTARTHVARSLAHRRPPEPASPEALRTAGRPNPRRQKPCASPTARTGVARSPAHRRPPEPASPGRKPMGVRPRPRPCRTAGAKPRSTCSWATRTAGRTLIGWSPGRAEDGVVTKRRRAARSTPAAVPAWSARSARIRQSLRRPSPPATHTP